MVTQLGVALVRFVFGGLFLFLAAWGWADDDGDFVDDSFLIDVPQANVGSHHFENVSHELNEILLGHDNIQLHAVLMSRWVGAVAFVFNHFSDDRFSSDSWECLLQGFGGSFEGMFQSILNAFKSVYSNEVREVLRGDYTHAQAKIACLLDYLEYLLGEVPNTTTRSQLIAREYILRDDPPVFATYAERVEWFNAHPNGRIVHRHPFFIFMNTGYWSMRGWVNQYPILQTQRHGLFLLAHDGVNLGWIQRNVPPPYSIGSVNLVELLRQSSLMAYSQLGELLAGIQRTTIELNQLYEGGVPIVYIIRIAELLDPLYRDLIDQANIDQERLNIVGAIRLRIGGAILAAFLVDIYTTLGSNLPNPAIVDSVREQTVVWEGLLDDALEGVREMLEPEEEEVKREEDEEGVGFVVNLDLYSDDNEALEALIAIDDDDFLAGTLQVDALLGINLESAGLPY